MAILEIAEPMELAVQLDASGAGADEIHQLTRGLIVELRELPVEVRMPLRGSPAKGAKSGALITAGELAVTALPAVLGSVIALLRSWLKRGDGRSVKIKWADGKRSFALDLPSGTLSNDQLNKLLATLGAADPAASRKTPTPTS